MPAEVVSFLFTNVNLKNRLQLYLVIQCAPFLKGFKAACMMNMERECCCGLEHVLMGTDVEYRILTENKGKCLIFLFRRKVLTACLEKDEIKEFLRQYGYVCHSLDIVLRRLSDRVRRYSGRDIGFPHEIGVFLGYPIEDVRCFIERGGKGEVMSGYWKVYCNPGRAQLLFLAYDKARASAVNEYLAGRTIREIAE